jgi:cellulose synthase/poly-beta-1,6-N-acetylglucosamine synthase-like glycosyltransferase
VTAPATALLLLLALPAGLSTLYLALLTALSAKPRLPPCSSRRLRFDVVVPAHDEAAVIVRIVDSLRRLDWPRERFRLLVVADNCSDRTAELARGAGAEVLERRDPAQRGKGYALALAFRHSLASGFADAVVVVDADSVASANLLEAFACRLERGALAVQAHYGILNPMDSWRTRLLTIAKAAFHIIRSRTRERLGLSCGIRGNGWCVSSALLRRMPYRYFSLAEDLEYGIALGLAGCRVHYADEAHVDGEMVVGAALARQQRQRWEDGRLRLVRTHALPLLYQALRRRSGLCLDLALDLLLLPLSYVTLSIALLIAAAAFLQRLGLAGPGWLWLGGACTAVLAVHVLRAWQLSGVGRQGLLDLLHVPAFIAWKLRVMLGRRDSRGWVSTKREGT